MIKQVTTAEASRLVSAEGYAFIDVRTPAEYAAGHPSGALNVPFLMPGKASMVKNPDFVAVMRGLFALDAPLVVGCAAGMRSLSAAEHLVEAGFTRVVDQRAGYVGLRDMFGGLSEPGWSSSGLPTEVATPGGSYTELLERVRL